MTGGSVWARHRRRKELGRVAPEASLAALPPADDGHARATIEPANHRAVGGENEQTERDHPVPEDGHKSEHPTGDHKADAKADAKEPVARQFYRKTTDAYFGQTGHLTSCERAKPTWGRACSTAMS